MYAQRSFLEAFSTQLKLAFAACLIVVTSSASGFDYTEIRKEFVNQWSHFIGGFSIPNQKPADAMSASNPIFVAAIVEWCMSVGSGISHLTSDQITSYVSIVMDESVKRQVDPLLVLAIISIESRFDAKARNPSGASGLMQIVGSYHTDKISKKELFDPSKNIKAGVQILQDSLTAHRNDEAKALLSYNGSLKTPGAKYHKKVMHRRDDLKKFVEKSFVTDTLQMGN